MADDDLAAKDVLSDAEMLRLLREKLQIRGATKSLAETLGISAAMVSGMAAGNRPITPMLARYLGYDREYSYRKVPRG